MIKNFIKAVRELRNAHIDAKEGRKLMGTDRHSNKYYQYFDREGYETKREVEYARKFADDEVDLYWDAWLKHKQREPPSPEQLKELYEEEEKYREAAYSYEKRDMEMMKQYRKEQTSKAKQENPQTSQAQGFGERFEPGKWNPGGKK